MTSDFKSILDMGSERAVADLAVKVMEEHPESFPDMLNLCWLDKYPLSMRAARAVQLYCEKHPEEIYPFLDEVLENTRKSSIDGVRRNFLKVIAEFIELDRIYEPGLLLNTCFEWLLDGRIQPATRIHSMAIIYKLGLNEPALLQELAASIEIIMDESEISLKTSGKKMLQRIVKHKINPPPVKLPQKSISRKVRKGYR